MIDKIIADPLRYFKRLRWHGEVACPECGSVHVYDGCQGYICADCGHRFSDTSGTIFHATKLPLVKWLLALYYLIKSPRGISSYTLARFIGVTQPTAWRMLKQLRSVMPMDEPSGEITIDEVWIGPKFKFIHNTRKRQLTQRTGLRGKNLADSLKHPIIGIYGEHNHSKFARSLCLVPLHTPYNKSTVKSQFLEHTRGVTHITSDDTSLYDDAAQCLKVPQSKNSHSMGYYKAPDGRSSNRIENVFTHLRQTYSTYLHVSKKYLQSYLNTFAFRYLYRGLDFGEICLMTPEIRDLREQLRLQEEQFQEQLRQQEQLQEQLLQHEEEIERLKTLVASANNSISALHTSVLQMEAGGYVTSVIPREQNGTVTGYWLTFGSGDTIFLSTGEESTPRISVRAYNGGDYYWSLDDEFLLDGNGEMIMVEKGSTAPQFKAEEGNWYISTDSAASWTMIDKASSNTSLFKAIDTSNRNYVTITLADGTVLQLTTWSAHVTLQNIVNQLSRNLAALRRVVDALEENDYLQSVTPLYEDDTRTGWYFSFAKSGTVAVYSMESADYSLLHEAIKQSGQDDGPYIIGIDAADSDHVTLTLSDDSSISIPRYQGTTLSVDVPIWDTDQPGSSYTFFLIGLDETVSCSFHLEGTDLEDAEVTAFSDGNFVVSVIRSAPSEGMLNVTCIRKFEEGFVTLLLTDASGKCTTRNIRILYKTPSISYNGDPYQLEEGLNFTLPASSGTFRLLLTPYHFMDFGYSPSSHQWGHVTMYTSLPNNCMVIYIDENNKLEDRYLTVDLKDSSAQRFSIRIKQEGNPTADPNPYWEVDRITFPWTGGEYSFKVNVKDDPAREVGIDMGDNINVIWGENTGDYIVVTFSVAPNPDGFLYSVPINSRLANGTILVEQLHR